MSEMRIYPLIKNIEGGEGNIDKHHLKALNNCYSLLSLELNKVKDRFTSVDVTLDDFNKIQELKSTLEYIENRIKEVNLRVYNKELALIENFNPAAHKHIFKDTDLKEVILSGVHYNTKASNWYELTVIVCNHIISIDKELFEKEVTKLKGKKRPYFLKDKGILKREKELENTDYLIESNFSAYETVCTCIKILDAFNFKDDVIVVFNTEKS